MRPGTALPALLLCQGVLIAGLTLSFPFVTLYLHERRGLAMGLVGAAVGLSLLGTAAGQALGGELADLWGCKRVMALAACGRATFSGLLSAAVLRDWPVSAVAALLMGGAFLGNFYDPAVKAWVAHEHPPQDRVRAYGLLRMASNAAWAIGPALGGFMAGRSYALMFAVTAAACLGCAALLACALPPAPPRRLGEVFAWRPMLGVAADGRYLRLCAVTALIAVSISQLVSPLSVHAREHAGLSEEGIGLLFAVNGALVVLLQRAATGVASRCALTSAAAAGCLFYAAGWTWVGFSRSWTALALGIAVVTLGEVALAPTVSALAANLAPQGRRGRYLGFHGLSYQLGYSMGPALGGLGLEHLRGAWAPAPWLAAGALAVAASLGFRRLGRGLSPAEQGRPFQEVER